MKKELLLAGVSAFALMFAAATAPANAQDGARACVNGGTDCNIDNDVSDPSTVIGNTTTDPGTTRPNLIVDSYNGASGISQAQQNEGSANSMNVATAVQVGLADAGDIEAKAVVNTRVIDNAASQTNGVRENEVLTSYDGFAGVASVQQNNGDHNEMGIANAVQAQLSGATDSSAEAEINGLVQNNNRFDSDEVGRGAVQIGGERTNDVDQSFTNGASGVASVQQNNGNQNAMGLANGVQASITESSGDAVAEADFNGIVGIGGPQPGGVRGVGNISRQLGGERENDVDGSFTDFAGVASVQQNNGDHNAMGLANAVQMGIGGSGDSEAKAEHDLDTNNNIAGQVDGSRDNGVTSSFSDGATGVASVQQNNGNNNALGVANAIQVGIDNDGLVESTADIDASTNYNQSTQIRGSRENEVQDSFNGFSGVATVQQNNGDNNTVGAATALNGNLGGSGTLIQSATVDGSSFDQMGAQPDLDGNPVRDMGSVRDNLIDPSFMGAEGIFTVQQNNGNANAIGAATAVANNVGGTAAGGDNVTQTVAVVGTLSENADVEDGTSPPRGRNFGSERHNTITDMSFNGSSGIATVQQNNGDVNVMGVATAVNANIGLDQSQIQNDISQMVSVDGTIDNATSVDDDRWIDNETFVGQRQNNIGVGVNEDGAATAGVFNNASGIASVQQNNGSQNIMGIGTAVQANIDNISAGLDGNDDVDAQTAAATGAVNNSDSTALGTPVVTDTPQPGHRENVITDSFLSYTGFASVQQNNGDNNVMGVANAVAMTMRGQDKIDNVTSGMGASTSGTTDNNTARDGNVGSFFNAGQNRLNLIGTTDDGSTIVPAFNGFEGMATVQQNNGDNNVINAANTVVANIENILDPTDIAAGTVSNTASGTARVIDNTANDHRFSDRVNLVHSSFDDAAGILTVQQNNGSNNVLGASTAVAAELNNTTTGFGPALSTASLSATVSGNTTTVIPNVETPGRSNIINSSFSAATGIMVVQQNNGDNNAMQSAVSVTANIPFNGGSFMSGLPTPNPAP